MAVKELIKNKKYKIDIPIGYNGNKRIRHTETFYGGKKEAVLRENELKAQVKNNTYVNKSKITIKDLMHEFAEYNKDKWSPKTYIANIHWIANINGQIGHIPLQKLNVKILEDFYSYLKNETNYADKTIQHHYTLINSALNKAITWEYILVNPNNKVEKPKARAKEANCYSPEDVDKLLEVLQKESLKYQAIIYLALDSGIRRGELTRLNLGRY